VNVIVNIWFLSSVGNILTSIGTAIFSIRALFHGVSSLNLQLLSSLNAVVKMQHVP